MSTQPEALRLADRLTNFAEQDRLQHADSWELLGAAAELRRQHEVIAELLEALRGMVALEEETLRNYDDDDISIELRHARAAIARAEEVKP